MMTTKRTLKRGDVVLVLFPHSDLKTAKLRPALIVQTDKLATIAEMAIDRVIGKIPMKEVNKALKYTLGL